MTVKRDKSGVPVLVEMRCGGKGGRCGLLVASVREYFGNLVLVEHLISDEKTPLDVHGGIAMSGCPRHGVTYPYMRRGHHWLEQSVDVDLEHAAEISKETGRTLVVPVSAMSIEDDD
jgi:hypothetical protein